MDRREAVKNMALLMGIALSAPTVSALYGGCQSKNNIINFSEEEEKIIEEIANTIIPDTNTPGAKVAGVGPFIVMMINDCYENNDKRRFKKGLKKINRMANKALGKKFLELSSQEKNSFITKLAEDAHNYKIEEEQKKAQTTELIDFRGRDAANKPTGEDDNDEKYFYPIIHELTVLGYFTSEIGATQALAYIAIPGKYDPCTEMSSGQKAWVLN